MGIEVGPGGEGQDFVAPIKVTLTPEQRTAQHAALLNMTKKQPENPLEILRKPGEEADTWHEDNTIAREADLLIHPNEAGLAFIDKFKAATAAAVELGPWERTADPKRAMEHISRGLNAFPTVAQQVAYIKREVEDFNRKYPNQIIIDRAN